MNIDQSALLYSYIIYKWIWNDQFYKLMENFFKFFNNFSN